MKSRHKQKLEVIQLSSAFEENAANKSYLFPYIRGNLSYAYNSVVREYEGSFGSALCGISNAVDSIIEVLEANNCATADAGAYIDDRISDIEVIKDSGHLEKRGWKKVAAMIDGHIDRLAAMREEIAHPAPAPEQHVLTM